MLIDRLYKLNYEVLAYNALDNAYDILDDILDEFSDIIDCNEYIVVPYDLTFVLFIMNVESDTLKSIKSQ